MIISAAVLNFQMRACEDSDLAFSCAKPKAQSLTTNCPTAHRPPLPVLAHLKLLGCLELNFSWSLQKLE